mgnify:CR=1 FL=1
MNTSYEHIAPDNDVNTRVNNFYSVCVDKFFRNPDKFRKWGLSLPKEPDPNGKWPGKRTKPLYEYDNEIHNELILKVFSAYIDLRYNNVSWDSAETSFQEIDTFDKELYKGWVGNSIVNRGWIHKDTQSYNDNDLAFIIYMTPNADKDSGISLFNLNSNNTNASSMRKQHDKERMFKGEEIDEKEYEENISKHESYFTEKSRFYNVYNRMIAYDSNEYHRANNFVTNAEKRLTLIGFVKGIKIDEMPLQRVRSSDQWDNNLEKRIDKI